MAVGAPTVLVDGLGFPEAPRWHDGRLWFSDMALGRVRAIAPDGGVEDVCEVPGRPSGLGWLPDGRLLVVSMQDRVVLRGDPQGLVVHADLGEHVRADLNDMVVDGTGRAWVTNFGYDPDREDPVATGIVRVDADGTSELVAGDLLRPNGIAVAPDGRTLVVAETRVHRVTAFTITGAGLVDRRVVGDLGSGSWADGICLDAEGGVWVGDPRRSRCVRVLPGRGVVAAVETGRPCVACALGGDDRRTLFLLEAPLRPMDEGAADPKGRIERLTVDVAGAGWP